MFKNIPPRLIAIFTAGIALVVSGNPTIQMFVMFMANNFNNSIAVLGPGPIIFFFTCLVVVIIVLKWATTIRLVSNPKTHRVRAYAYAARNGHLVKGLSTPHAVSSQNHRRWRLDLEKRAAKYNLPSWMNDVQLQANLVEAERAHRAVPIHKHVA